LLGKAANIIESVVLLIIPKFIIMQSTNRSLSSRSVTPSRNQALRNSKSVEKFSLVIPKGQRVIADYMMKEKEKKSFLSFSTAVKRFFVLDFASKKFYYKSASNSTNVKGRTPFKVSLLVLSRTRTSSNSSTTRT